MMLKSHPAIVAGLGPGTPTVRALSRQNRDLRDEPVYDPREMGSGSI
jgi:hypothetical protein